MQEVGEEAVEQSTVLSKAEVGEALSDTPDTPEVVLPSDENKFEIPEKFEGKSIEEVIKSYQELEKMKGGDTSQEEKVDSIATEESLPEPTKVEEEQYQKYAESLDNNGSLSDSEYAELAEAGYDKVTVDAEIQRRSELKEFNEYKKNKTLDDMLEPLGGGRDRFKEVSNWANTTKSKEEMVEFNKTLAAVPKVAQQALLRQLYSEYETAGNEITTTLHTNSKQTTPNKGYSTQEEFFKDVGSEEYKNNAAYRAAVEKKMAISTIF